MRWKERRSTRKAAAMGKDGTADGRYETEDRDLPGRKERTLQQSAKHGAAWYYNPSSAARKRAARPSSLQFSHTRKLFISPPAGSIWKNILKVHSIVEFEARDAAGCCRSRLLTFWTVAKQEIWLSGRGGGRGGGGGQSHIPSLVCAIMPSSHRCSSPRDGRSSCDRVNKCCYDTTVRT